NRTDGDNTSDSFTVVVKDSDGDEATGTLTIDIIDDVPTARDDNGGIVVEGATTASELKGNVLDNDKIGADGYKDESVKVEWSTASNNAISELAKYGSLELNSDGKWSFMLDNNKPATQALKEGETINVKLPYTITDKDGDKANAELSFSIQGTNDIPVIENAVVNVSEEGLIEGIKDSTGTSDTTDEKTVSGKISITDPDNDSLTVTLQKPTQIIQAKDTDGVFKDIVWTGDNTKTLVGKVGDTEVIKVTIDDSGSYTVDLLAPVKHPKNSVEDIVSLDFGVVANDGKVSTTGKLTVNIEDDMPTVANTDTVWATKQKIPDIFNGEVSFKGNQSSSNQDKFIFKDGAVEVTAKGFKGKNDLTLIDAKVNQSQAGLGVASKDSPYHNIANEIDYRIGKDGKGASEELTIKLTGGKVSFGATISFEAMYGRELETGVALFYRDGVLISTQEFTSDATSGNYAKNFEVKDGGFDTIVLKALDNGKPASHKDNSDFTVSGVTFFGTTDAQPISYAEGTVSYQFGADGKGFVGFTGTSDEITTASGKEVTINHTNNEIIARDSDGKLVYQVQFTPATGKWEFFQYQEFEIIDGVGEVLDIGFIVTDSDGDKVETSIQIGVNKVPVVSAESIVVHEEDMASGSQAKGEKNFADGVINLKSGADISTIAIGNTSISIDKIYAGSGDDIINGEAGKDVIYGGAGDDRITTDLHTIPKSGTGKHSTPAKIEGDLLIDGGEGFDTLILSGDNNIDFSILNVADRIHNIEAIDLTNGKHDLKNLKLDDVLKMTDSNKELIIFGDQGDSVNFKNTVGENNQKQTWSKSDTIIEDGKTFEVYINSGDESLKVKVEQPISDGITN
ncbi:VCBS domain-containing protein, partial [Aliarcobacter cryaerophilus]|uniref:VCBS domain-containing protein n=1 Tax=Aliarcobacter cryaerophilus TaxID=28198 RepID=UPI003DA68F50